MKYEFKKIFVRKSTIISIAIMTLYLVLMLIFEIGDALYVNPDGSTVSGVKAIHLDKKAKMSYNGILTTDYLAEILEENQIIVNDPEYANVTAEDIELSNQQYAKTQGFEDIRDIINNSYGKFREYDYYLINHITPDQAGEFYSNRIQQLQEWLDSDDAQALSTAKKDYVLKAAKTLKTPWKYSYADGWQSALEFSSVSLFGLVFVICIVMAPIFSVEYQTGSDSIVLSTIHGKKKGIRTKLLTGFLMISAIYWGVMLLTNGIIFAIYGFEGGSSPIQAYFSGWKSTYPICLWQALVLSLLLGYVGCIFIGFLTMYLSAKLKTSFASIVLILMVVMCPAIIESSFNLKTGAVAQQILAAMPHQMLQGSFLIRSYSFFEIAGKIVTPFQLLFPVYLFLGAVLLPFTYLTFRRHEVK